MEIVGDYDYHMQLALAARQRADASDDADLSRRLREVAIRHERRARTLLRLARSRKPDGAS
ncbi:MAG TPA: hypothetical protein VFP14_03470 [Novosphingobium sp.]|nr:hypothetical protein [Novosphingobium sp.]